MRVLYNGLINNTEVYNMKHTERMNRDALDSVAIGVGKTREQVCADIQAAIDAAWESESVEAKGLQKRLFPNGKPTPEEFIAVMANEAAKTLLNPSAQW